MLLDMLTADAAKHGHEHSPPSRASSPTNNGSFLVQMPLSIIGSYLRRQTPSPSLATSTASPNTNNADLTDAPDTPTPRRNVMTNDDNALSSALSRPASSGSSVAEERPKKRASRPKTSYLIAKPAQPVNPRSKLYIRPKVLLQLHQILAAQRPKPVYEVIPFSLCPQRSTRRLARTFNTRERLGPHDLLVVEAEAYTSKEEEKKSDEERWASREVIGVISPGKCEKGTVDKAEICMNDGMSRWEVTAMSNGGYEFNSTDDHGLTLKARWVLKPVHSRRVSSMSTGAQLSPTFAPGQEDKKFTFSTISANSRRHPIIATMTHARIDVMDNYAMPSATSPPTPGYSSYTQSPALTPSSIDMNSFMDKTSFPIETDDALRRFIVVSGIWVASENFCSSHAPSQPSTPTLNPSATFRPSNNRTVSMSFLDTPRSMSPASTIEENHRSIPKLFRTGTGRLPRSTSSAEPPPSPASTRTVSNASPVLKTRSRRANSTGTAQLHNMTGSMRKRYGLAFEDQALPETEEERQTKWSEEITRIRELALPSPNERRSIEKSVAEVKTLPMSTSVPSPSVVLLSFDGPVSPTPLLSPPLNSPPLLSPSLPHPERARKTQSAYNPITTTGMWDSGVTEGPGLKKRPTSMFVLNERKRKQDKKSERSKSKDNIREGKARRKENGEGCGLKRKSDWYKYKIKLHLKGLFHKEKA